MNLRRQSKGLLLHCIVNVCTSHLQIENNKRWYWHYITKWGKFWITKLHSSPNQYGRRVKAIHSGDDACARFSPEVYIRFEEWRFAVIVWHKRIHSEILLRTTQSTENRLWLNLNVRGGQYHLTFYSCLLSVTMVFTRHKHTLLWFEVFWVIQGCLTLWWLLTSTYPFGTSMYSEVNKYLFTSP